MEASRFAWVLPAEIEAPANLVREILKATMRYTVVQEHHSSEWHLTSHFSLSDVNVVGFLDLTLWEVNVPGVTSTASVSEGPPDLVTSRDHLREDKHSLFTKLTRLKSTHLHAPICEVCIQQGNPGSGLECVEGTRVKVAIVLMPGNCGLLILRSLCPEVPDRMP